MQIIWQKLIVKIFFWLLIEAIFSIIGIDDLADYSEFIFTPKVNLKTEYYLAT